MSNSDDNTFLIVILLSITASIIIIVIAYLYFNKSSGNGNGIYGTYTDTNNKVQPINTLPMSFNVNTIDAIFPGCTPKPGFPTNDPRYTCTKGAFNINGYINENGNLNQLQAIAGVFSARSPGAIFQINLSQASQSEYNTIKS